MDSDEGGLSFIAIPWLVLLAVVGLTVLLLCLTWWLGEASPYYRSLRLLFWSGVFVSTGGLLALVLLTVMTG